MPSSVFISYRHKQEDWVWNRLVPVLRAAGVSILIDRERFRAARAVKRQMDEVQDQADCSILVLSPDYLASDACLHEMNRAIARDPEFETGVTIPIVRHACPLPASIARPDPIHVDLCDDSRVEPWDLLLRTLPSELGIDAPAWLRARDRVVRHLERGDSVNLVVTGKARWRPVVEHLREHPSLGLGWVRLDSTEAMSRRSLVETILAECGCPAAGSVPPKPDDLVVLGRNLRTLSRAARLALTSFDHVGHRMHDYEVDLFVALRDLTMDARKLVLLVVSHAPFATLLPRDHPLSEMQVAMVELKGRP